MKKNEEQIESKKIESQLELISKIKNLNNIGLSENGIQKHYHIVTYGCAQNENDSEKLKGMLLEMGYAGVDKKEDADLILYNTCCVRENAELKVLGNVGALKHLKKKKPDLIIGICGCMMQQEHFVEELKKKYKHIDIIFGTHTLYKFPEILYKVLKENERVVDVIDTDGEIFEGIPIRREDTVKAGVSIMYGCNNFCSYCIVPYVRGRERSREPEEIIREIKMLANEGYKDITLLGQNVNSYGKTLKEKLDFADLLSMVNDIKGIERIRFMTSHPKDISDKLINTMAQCDKVCESLHLPIQAGSNEVLKKMNRKYTKEKYLETIEKVKKAIPGISLSSDIIVGFPGETNEDFQETLKVIEEVRYDSVYMFIYSPRKGTPAAEFEDIFTYKEKHKNFETLMKVQNEISYQNNLEYVGQEVEVLVEGRSKNDIDLFTGRTRTNKIVNFKANETMIGKLIKVYIKDCKSFYLIGETV